MYAQQYYPQLYAPQGIDENMMGAAAPARPVLRSVPRPMARPMQPYAQRPQIYSSPPLPQMPAQPNRAVLRSYLGMGFATWGAADASDKVLLVAPQESFKGERLVIDLSVTSGPSAGLVLLRRIDIGTQPQSPSVAAPAPAAMFSAAATYSKLDLQIAFRAMEIQVTLGITAAPGGASSVTAAVGFFGVWIR